MTTFTVSELVASTDYSDSLAINSAERSIHDFASGSVCVDHFTTADCFFVRLNGGGYIELLFDGQYTFLQVDSGGYLGRPLAVNQPFLWIPRPPLIRQINSDLQIISEQPASFSSFLWNDKGAAFAIQAPENTSIDFIIWRLPLEVLTEEISSILPSEAQGYFLWGSHGCISKPADLYRHLIYGAVYDLRYSWPHNKKCFSENEAHALYTVFSGL